MNILKPQSSHTNEIAKLLTAVVTDLRNKGIYQWDNHYPNSEVIANDIANNCLYICYEESVCGCISINEEQEEEYSSINWNENGRFLCIHRLMVHPKFQGKGIGKQLLQFAIDYGTQNGYSSIRLDAYSGNPIAMKLYRDKGFETRGELYFPRRELPFVCMERDLL